MNTMSVMIMITTMTVMMIMATLVISTKIMMIVMITVTAFNGSIIATTTIEAIAAHIIELHLGLLRCVLHFAWAQEHLDRVMWCTMLVLQETHAAVKLHYSFLRHLA